MDSIAAAEFEKTQNAKCILDATLESDENTFKQHFKELKINNASELKTFLVQEKWLLEKKLQTALFNLEEGKWTP